MKNIVKLIMYIGLFVAVYLTSEDIINRIIPYHDTVTNTTLLFQYGGMIGYSLFIIFMMMLQAEFMRKTLVCKPRLSKSVYYSYVGIGIIFIILTLSYFTLQIAIIMALLFMLITAILDMIRDKIIQNYEGNQLHPKKTI